MTEDSPIVIPPGVLEGARRKEIAGQLRVRYELRPDLSVRSIAAETGRSYSFVHKLLREAETELRPTGHDSGRSKQQRAELAAELRKRYEADINTTCQSLARTYGLSQTIVYRYLKNAGTKMRRTGRPWHRP